MITNLFVGLFITLIWLILVLIVVIGLRFLIKTKRISKTFKIIIIALTLFCAFILFYDYEIISDLYIEMNEMVDNKRFIGLSEEEVIELLGEPMIEYRGIDNTQNYTYSAGTTSKKHFWSREYNRKVYELEIDFDKNGKVEYAYVKECP